MTEPGRAPQLAGGPPAGRFFLLGWAAGGRPVPARVQAFARAWRLPCRVWTFGERGSLFLVNTHPATADDGQAVLVAAGMARTLDGQPLSAPALLGRVGPGRQRLDLEDLDGNVILAALSQREPCVTLYQSLAAPAQLYYARGPEGWLCGDTLRHLVAVLDQVDLDPEVLPYHLLCRIMAGERTYFRQIRQALPGSEIVIAEADWRITQRETFTGLTPARQFRRPTPQAEGAFEAETLALLGRYLRSLERGPHVDDAVLFSGGVDSTLLAYLLQELRTSGPRLKTITYTVDVPSFAQDRDYAASSAARLHSDQQFVDVPVGDYLSLLEATTRLLAQPVDNEQDPCYLLLARELDRSGRRWVWSGSDPGCLFGTEKARRYRQVDFFRRLPGARAVLGFLGEALRGALPHKAYGLREVAARLEAIDEPYSPRYVLNQWALWGDFERSRQVLSAESLRWYARYQRDFTAHFGRAPSLLEQVHIEELFADVHYDEVVLTQVFRAYQVEMLTPFLDSQFFRLAARFAAGIRYRCRGEDKWLLKRLLARRLGREVAYRPKRSGGFQPELFEWLRAGQLADRLRASQRPGFMSRAAFDDYCDRPDWLSWTLLTYDILREQIAVLRQDAGR